MKTVRRQRRWRGFAADALVVALLLFLCLTFFWQVLTPDPLNRRWLPKGDFTDQFYAFRHYQAQELWSGRLPLWNSNALSGFPFLADIQAAVYYPLGLLIILLFGKGGLPLIAVEIEVVLHFFLISLFTYLLVKQLTGSRIAGLVSGITYAYGTYLTYYPRLQMGILEGQTWVPLALLAVHLAAKEEGKARRGPCIAWLAFGGVALGLSALAGHGQTFLLASYTVMAFLLFSFYPFWKGTSWAKRLGLLGLALFLPLVALGLGAAQLIPSLEYMQLTTRAQLSFKEAGGGFFFNDLLSLVLPGTRLLYLGTLPLILALLALVLKRRRETVFWGVVAILALLLTLGNQTTLYMFFYLFAPGFDLFQGQERALQVLSLAAAILAGYGTAVLDRPMEHKTKHRYGAFFHVLLWANLGAVILAFFALWGAQNFAAPDQGPVNGFLERSVLLIIVLGLSTLVLYLRLGHKLRGWRLGLLLVAVIVFDLFTLNYDIDLQKARARDRFLVRPSVQFLQDEPGTFRVWDEYLLPGNFGVVWDLESTSGISPLRLQRYENLFRYLPAHKARQLLNVGYAVSSQHLLPDGDLLEEFSDPEKDVYYHRMTDPGSRACMVYSVQVEADDAVALQRMAADDFDPCQTVFLSEPTGISLPGSGDGRVQIEEHLPNHLALAVDSDSDGILLLSEIFYPGWQATVDGEKVEILRADTTLRAVPVEAGSHQVELDFRPWTVMAGLLVAVVTLVAVLVSVLWLRKRDG